MGENVVVNGPICPLLCDYITMPAVASTLDKTLFSRLLRCSEAEVSERLRLNSPAERLSAAAHIVQSNELNVQAGSLLLRGHSPHPAVATLNSALQYLKRIM